MICVFCSICSWSLYNRNSHNDKDNLGFIPKCLLSFTCECTLCVCFLLAVKFKINWQLPIFVHCSDQHICFFVYVDRDYQQDQRASSFVPACCVSRWGPTGCHTGHETGVEWGAGEKTDLWGDLQTGIHRIYIIFLLCVWYTQHAQITGDTVPVPSFHVTVQEHHQG